MGERGGEGLPRVREAGGGPEDLTQDGQITDDQRDARCERLHRGESEALLEEGEREDVGRGHERRQIGLRYGAEDDRLDPESDDPGAYTSMRSREPLRCSIPPTVRTYGPRRARQAARAAGSVVAHRS